MTGRIIKVISGPFEGTYGKVVSFDMDKLIAYVQVSQQSLGKSMGQSQIVVNTADLKTID